MGNWELVKAQVFPWGPLQKAESPAERGRCPSKTHAPAPNHRLSWHRPLFQWILYLAWSIRKENLEDNLIGVENYFSITLQSLGRGEKPVLSPEGLTSVYLLSDSCMPPTHHSPTHHHHQLAGDSRREPSQGLGLPVSVLRKLKWTTLCLCVQILNYHFNLTIISYMNFIGLP